MYIAPAISMLQVGSSLEVEGEATDREKDNSTEVEQNTFFCTSDLSCLTVFITNHIHFTSLLYFGNLMGVFFRILLILSIQSNVPHCM